MVSPVVGTVLERDGAVYRVATPGGTVRAVLRGKAKRGLPRVVVGDVVQLEPEPGGELFGVVDVEPRRSLLARRVPEGRGARPVAANVDHVFVVTATTDPAPRWVSGFAPPGTTSIAPAPRRGRASPCSGPRSPAARRSSPGPRGQGSR